MPGVEKALGLLKNLPRVSLGNLKPLPCRKQNSKARRGQHTGRKCGRGHGGQSGRSNLPPLGHEGGNMPFFMSMPKEPYYAGQHVRRQYPPLSLLQLQRLIDLGWINTSEPVDLTTISNAPLKKLDIKERHYGYNLTDEGVDIFDAKINIEVQWASEMTIAAVEKNGGTINTKFYDLNCVEAMCNAEAFLRKGIAIPRNKLPPEDAVDYYTDPKNRGYLADPEKINECRLNLAQKYGYLLPDIEQDPMCDMLMARKDPRQIWFGLEPGWVINLEDKTILKPTNQVMQEYYQS